MYLSLKSAASFFAASISWSFEANSLSCSLSGLVLSSVAACSVRSVEFTTSPRQNWSLIVERDVVWKRLNILFGIAKDIACVESGMKMSATSKVSKFFYLF